MWNESEMTTENSTISNAITRILSEHEQLFSRIQLENLDDVVQSLHDANRIFLIGAGRTGFMIKAAAMRLMHLGYTVYVVGETNTPAISNGDLLLAASGSGTTGSIVKAAETARKSGAAVISFSTNQDAPLAQLAQHSVIIPAAGKQEFHTSISAQYAGSLFEQSFLILFDGLVHFLWKKSKTSPEELWTRHANME
ncbi:6-phospho-3-hexuloisomerase [Echinicola vietnamensis]|uniref:6-phospho 3-hexuloisomerase n=1 Tax=Echinicola vietnamensis (strain DSM 17526 / LMG 23754 / KMM 6221) TaxID=926556 RepID=L0G0M7_ECHVK|nr:6-phospho-3-hexuloisomerase [Echinicola vietnamensis]AGA79749.1 6-phospho 3-hexuloisomerase [Echinicola vietnamensis DSM 17526]